MLRQLLYVSSSNPPGVKIGLDTLFDRSRHNNAIDGVTGLLFTDGFRFVQVLEGSDDAVGSVMARIRADERHRDIRVIRDGLVPAREFGFWSMADRRHGERSEEFDERLRLMLRNATTETRESFLDLLCEAEPG